MKFKEKTKKSSYTCIYTGNNYCTPVKPNSILFSLNFYLTFLKKTKKKGQNVLGSQAHDPTCLGHLNEKSRSIGGPSIPGPQAQIYFLKNIFQNNAR